MTGREREKNGPFGHEVRNVPSTILETSLKCPVGKFRAGMVVNSTALPARNKPPKGKAAYTALFPSAPHHGSVAYSMLIRHDEIGRAMRRLSAWVDGSLSYSVWIKEVQTCGFPKHVQRPE